MDSITCPHCGFRNFAISSYCGRCERPLKSDVPEQSSSPQTSQKATTPAPTTQTAQPPAPQPSAARPPAAQPPPRQTPTQAPVVVQKPVTPPQNPKMPPLALNVPDITETVLPQINAQPSAPPPPASPPPPAAAVTQPSAENSIAAPQLSPQDGDVIEVPVRIANGPRLLATRLIDATLAGLAGALFAFFETVVSGNDIVIESVSFADRLAQWIYYHPTAAGHGFLAAVALGAVHNFIGGLSGGRTIGRRLTHTVLVRMDGKKVHVGTILLRSLGSLISLAAFGAGFFWVLVDRHRRTWHDILAGTVVVNSRIKKP